MRFRIFRHLDCSEQTPKSKSLTVFPCFLQLSTIERQVFDFLGYMWAPIIGNFFQIICTIFGIFGTYQYRPKFIVVVSQFLTLNAPIATKVVCFSRLLKCLRSLCGKQCGPRSDCSYRSSLFWVHAVCFYT